MRLTQRLKQMIKADANAVLDRIEDPEALLRQSIRDMETALVVDAAELEDWQHRQERLIQETEHYEATLARLQDELDLCLDEQNDDLARHVIKQKLETMQQLQRVNSQLDTVLDTLKQKHEQFQERQSVFETIQCQAQVAEHTITSSSPATNGIGVSDHDIAIQLLKEKQSRGAA